MRKKIKEEKGSIAVYTIVTILSFIIILTGIFLTAASVRKNQLRTLPEIKVAYEKDLERKQEIYEEQISSRSMKVNIIGYSGIYDGVEHDEFSSFQIMDGQGQDITSKVTVRLQAGDVLYNSPQKVKNVLDSKTVNYTISHPDYDSVTGTVKVEVLPAKLTVTTESATKSHDGTPLTAGGNYTGLVNGETISINITGTQTERGTSANSYNLVWNGTAKQTNYEVIENLGILEVI
ncbi:MAG: hypothetical protein HFJ28_06175 [Clostridia bacterium]|jgi:hypothetical protein|nr:hypothetical protein [Clostridia bacterium]